VACVDALKKGGAVDMVARIDKPMGIKNNQRIDSECATTAGDLAVSFDRIGP